MFDSRMLNALKIGLVLPISGTLAAPTLPPPVYPPSPPAYPPASPLLKMGLRSWTLTLFLIFMPMVLLGIIITGAHVLVRCMYSETSFAVFHLCMRPCNTRSRSSLAVLSYYGDSEGEQPAEDAAAASAHETNARKSWVSASKKGRKMAQLSLFKKKIRRAGNTVPGAAPLPKPHCGARRFSKVSASQFSTRPCDSTT